MMHTAMYRVTNRAIKFGGKPSRWSGTNVYFSHPVKFVGPPPHRNKVVTCIQIALKFLQGNARGECPSAIFDFAERLKIRDTYFYMRFFPPAGMETILRRTEKNVSGRIKQISAEIRTNWTIPVEVGRFLCSSWVLVSLNFGNINWQFWFVYISIEIGLILPNSFYRVISNNNRYAVIIANWVSLFTVH